MLSNIPSGYFAEIFNDKEPVFIKRYFLIESQITLRNNIPFKKFAPQIIVTEHKQTRRGNIFFHIFLSSIFVCEIKL